MEQRIYKRTNYTRKSTHPRYVDTAVGIIQLDSDVWLIPQSAITREIRFNREPLGALTAELKDYGYERLSTVSPSVSSFTLWVWLNHFSNFLQNKDFSNLDWNNFTISIFEKYLSHLRNKGIGYYFWHIQTVLAWMQLNHSELINDKIVREVTSWTIEGNSKGKAVELNDPFQGALTTAETDAIRTAALNPRSPATLLERVVILLLVETGQRNEQLCKLETSNLKRIGFKTSGDTRHYQPEQVVRHIVLMPSNKTSQGLRELSISAELFRTCLELAKENQKLKNKIDGKPLLIVDPERQPIFRVWYDADKERWSKIRRPNSWDLNSLVKGFCERCGIPDRFGNPINIFARRFRRTVATRLVEQGASPEEVAALLDHADTQQVMVYFEFHQHRKQQRLEEAAGPFFRSLGDSIKGKLIANATEARNPEARIVIFDDETQDNLGIANCGRDMEKLPLCHESIPYACYGCSYHQPWISDVHERVAEKLKKRKEQLIQIQGREVGRLPAGLDILIGNVVRVANAVQEKKIEMEQVKPF